MRRIKLDFYLPRSSRVVVTGAFGFIGSHVTGALLEAGVDVVAVDIRPPSRDVLGRYGPRAGTGRLSTVLADVSDSLLDDVLGTVDAVIHLAGIAGVRQSWGAMFERYLKVNVLGAQRILEASMKNGVSRLIVASSSSVYGAPEALPTIEDSTLRPLSPYGVSKLAAEALCETYVRAYGGETQVVLLRYFTVYGPRQRGDMFIARLMNAAVTGNPVLVNGSGRGRRDFTYVDDVVAATLQALRGEGLTKPVEIVNVGTGINVTLSAVISMVEEIAGRAIQVKHAPTRIDEPMETRADIRRAERFLGYRPGTSLEVGLSNQFDVFLRDCAD